MITKERFVNIINRIKAYNDLQDKIQELFRDNIDNRENDFMNAGSICVGHETIVVELLEHIFDDTDTISWWLYENDYGRDTEIKVWDKNGREIDLSTPEKLYDYLIGGKK